MIFGSSEASPADRRAHVRSLCLEFWPSNPVGTSPGSAQSLFARDGRSISPFHIVTECRLSVTPPSKPNPSAGHFAALLAHVGSRQVAKPGSHAWRNIFATYLSAQPGLPHKA